MPLWTKNLLNGASGQDVAAEGQVSGTYDTDSAACAISSESGCVEPAGWGHDKFPATVISPGSSRVDFDAAGCLNWCIEKDLLSGRD